ncbi:MAG: AI-2E family transporter [Nanoarchaeota archaeon]|nr:AI-2E family transporter [Nanoarchaeota archaeon]
MNLNTLKLSQYSLILIGIAVICFALYQFQGFLRPFSIALLLVFLTISFYRLPLKQRLIKLSYTFLFTIITISLIYSFFFFSGVDSQEEIELSGQFIFDSTDTVDQNFIDSFQNQFYDLSISDYVSYEEVERIAQNFIALTLGSISTFLSELFLVILFYIFLVPSYEPALRYLKEKVFNLNSKEFEKTILQIEGGIKSYLSIKLAISFATAITSGFILAIFGVQNIFILMIIIFALNFIPNIGSFIAVFVAIVLYAVQVGIGAPLIIFGILLTIVQVFYGSVLEPKIAGKGLNLPPVFILLSLFFWGTLWGLGGMLISVPLTHAIKTIVEHLSNMSSVENLSSNLAKKSVEK